MEAITQFYNFFQKKRWETKIANGMFKLCIAYVFPDQAKYLLITHVIENTEFITEQIKKYLPKSVKENGIFTWTEALINGIASVELVRRYHYLSTFTRDNDNIISYLLLTAMYYNFSIKKYSRIMMSIMVTGIILGVEKTKGKILNSFPSLLQLDVNLLLSTTKDIAYTVKACVDENRNISIYHNNVRIASNIFGSSSLTEEQLDEICPLRYPGKNNNDINQDKCFEDTCNICLEKIETNQMFRTLPCSHSFHPHCVDIWLLLRSSKCPKCNEILKTKEE